MFVKYTQEQYRKLDADAFEARKAEVQKAIEDFDGSDKDLAMDDLKNEVRMIQEDTERRNLAVELRNAKAAHVAGGEGRIIAASEGQKSIRTAPAIQTIAPAQTDHERMLDSVEYRTAFRNYVVNGAPIPEQFRANTTVAGTYTQSTDVPVEVPSTMQAQIIQKMQERGGIYAAVSKRSIRAGIWFRVADLKVTASWIGENEVSPTQKATDATKISFSYYELECRIAQTLLAGAVTLEDFQSLFAQTVADAMVDALETAIISGTGSGQPLGITKDPRVTNTVTLKPADVANWKAWHMKVKAAIPRLYRNGTFIMAQETFDTYIETLSDNENRPVSITYNPVTGEEQYRLMGQPVQTVDSSVLAGFDAAKTGDVFAIYGRLGDYLLNTQTGMPMSVVKWIDHDNNLEKTKALMACDGKVLDANGFMLIKKGAAA